MTCASRRPRSPRSDGPARAARRAPWLWPRARRAPPRRRGRSAPARTTRAAPLASLREAARIEHERRDDLYAALRTLKLGVKYDPAQTLLPKIRELAAEIDHDHVAGTPRAGTLILLAILQQMVGAAIDPNAKINLLKLRAELREKQLADAHGAMAEWLRVLQIHPGSDEARFELDRLAERDNLWHLVLLVPAWELAQKPGKRDQTRLLNQLADLYENNLARPEYALRARVHAWRLNAASVADLPPRSGELGSLHARLWKLAELTGAFVTPPPPRDPLLWPHCNPPELADLAQWQKLGLHPITFARLTPAKTAAREPSDIMDLSEVEIVDETRFSGEIVLEPEPTSFRSQREPSGFMELSEVEELDDARLTGEIELNADQRAALRPRREQTGVVDLSEIQELDDFEDARLTGEIALSPAEMQALRPRREQTSIVDIAELEELDESGRGPATRGGHTSIVDIADLMEDDGDDELIETSSVPAVRPGQPALPRPQAKPARPATPQTGNARLPGRTGPNVPGPEARSAKPPGKPAAPPRASSRRPRRPPPPHPPPLSPPPRPPRPPPSPRTRARVEAVTAGLPPLPELTAPALPARPAVHSAWEELALAYASTPATSKPDKAQVAAALARLWDEGAHQPEPALLQLEAALTLTPDDTDLRSRLEDLAAREDMPHRVIEAYSRMIGELTVPEHVVGYGLRLADLYERTGQLDRAEEQYQAVVSVAPRDRDALRALARIHERSGREREYVDASARLLDLEAPELDVETRIGRTLALAQDLVIRVDRLVDATRRLEALAREFPAHPQVQERHADLLIRQGLWTRAVEALRASAATVPDPAFQLRATARIANLCEEHLAQIPQAIAAWKDIHQRRPDDAEALAQLQRLYLKTEQYGPLLPIVEQRLAHVAPDDRDSRIALLVVKARALQEGLGDEAAAMATLETLAAEAPENDDVLLGLSRLVRRRGRLDEGLQLLRRRLDDAITAAFQVSGGPMTDDAETPDPFKPLPVDPFGPIPEGETVDPRIAAAARIVKIAGALADALEHEANEPQTALTTIDEALLAIPADEEANGPGRAALVARKVALARAQGDAAALIDGLSSLAHPDGLLEAAALARSALGDRELATQLYTRVLATRNPSDPQQGKRLSSAIEGLVRLRIEAGDIDGADALMDAQLAELADTELRARILTEIGRTLLASLAHAPTQHVEPEPEHALESSSDDLGDAREQTAMYDLGDAPEATGTYAIADDSHEAEPGTLVGARPEADDIEEIGEAEPEEELTEVEEEVTDVEEEPTELTDDDQEPLTLIPQAPPRAPATPRPAPPDPADPRGDPAPGDPRRAPARSSGHQHAAAEARARRAAPRPHARRSQHPPRPAHRHLAGGASPLRGGPRRRPRPRPGPPVPRDSPVRAAPARRGRAGARGRGRGVRPAARSGEPDLRPGAARPPVRADRPQRRGLPPAVDGPAPRRRQPRDPRRDGPQPPRRRPLARHPRRDRPDRAAPRRRPRAAPGPGRARQRPADDRRRVRHPAQADRATRRPLRARRRPPPEGPQGPRRPGDPVPGQRSARRGRRAHACPRGHVRRPHRARPHPAARRHAVPRGRRRRARGR
jgi:tetratricopeptide (TPR) repeat protein